MAVTIKERNEKTRTLSGTSAKREYVITGATSEYEARNALLTASTTIIPATVDYLPASKQDWEVEELAVGVYGGTAVWKQSEYEAKKNQAPNTFRFSFDISGQTSRVFFSRNTRGNYAPTGKTAPNFKNAIGVTGDGTVEGCDVLVPYMTWTATFRVNAENVTSSYVAGLYNIVGTVNQSAWNGFAADTLLLTGVSGDKTFYTPEDGSNGYWVYDLTFKFAVSVNEDNMTIGDIQPFAKKGWDYVWCRYTDEVDDASKTIVRRPTSAHVERVYRYGNYGATLGWGA